MSEWGALLNEDKLRAWIAIVRVFTWIAGLFGVCLLFVDAIAIAPLVLLMLFMNLPAVRYLRKRARAVDAAYFSIVVYEGQSTVSQKLRIDVGVCVIAIVMGLIVVVQGGQLVYLSI